MNEYLIKIATLNEYKEMLKYKTLYEELCQSFKGIMEEIFAYCQRNQIELPERAFVNRTMDKARELIEYRIETTEGRCQDLTGRKGDNNLKEP